ncbi:MAG: HDOD domain-containing protein [Magnetococcales bacterium]|nr:HDOD domain-containing protein [Magnetococcales bacterium]
MGSRLNQKESHRLVRGFTVPTRPSAMLEALKTQQVFVQNPQAVAAAVLQDVALAAQVLQAANVQLTGYSRKVESIEVAMVLLGQDKLREITHELFLSVEIARKESTMQKMRIKSVRAGRILSWLSQELATLSPGFLNGHLPGISPDEAYLLGMFHDCGQWVLAQRFADYGEVLAVERPEGQTLESLEEERYQTSHAALGALLGEAWQWPKPLIYIVEAHHRLDAFAGRPVRERKYGVLHAMLVLTEWIEGDLLAWEWAQHEQHLQQLFALNSMQIADLRAKALAAVPLTSGTD